MSATENSRINHRTTQVRAVALFAALFFAFAPAVAAAGQVYGQITERNRPVSNAGPITLKCGNAQSPPATTDRFGAYKVYLRNTGRCEIVFNFEGRQLTHPVQSYGDPVRFNFEIIRSGSNLTLQRR